MALILVQCRRLTLGRIGSDVPVRGIFKLAGRVVGQLGKIAPAIVADALQKRCRVRLCHLKEGPPDEIIYYLLGRRRKPELTAAFLDCLDRELRRRRAGGSYLKKIDHQRLCASAVPHAGPGADDTGEALGRG